MHKKKNYAQSFDHKSNKLNTKPFDQNWLGQIKNYNIIMEISHNMQQMPLYTYVKGHKIESKNQK